MNEYRSKLQYFNKKIFKGTEQLPKYIKNKYAFLNRILANEQMAIVVWALDNIVIWCNRYARSMVGFTEDDLNGEINVSSIIPQDIVCHIKENLNSTEDRKLQYRYGGSLISRDGRVIYITWHNSIISNDEGKEYIVSTGIELTNLKNAEKKLEEANSDLTAANEELTAQQEELSAMNEELMAQEEELRNSLAELRKHQEMLKKSEERYKLVVEGASDGLWDWDIITNTAYISERWKNAIGFEKQEINDYYETFIKRVHPGDVKRVVKNLDTHIKEKTPHYTCEYRIKLRNGKYIWILSRGKALWDNEGKAVRMAGSHTDITEKKKAENKLKHLAYYDRLTDIPLRNTFMDRLKVSITDAKRNGLKLAVLFLDLDNFKIINDTCGHHIGDRLLKRVTEKLNSCIRNSDTLSRIGGDEFAILIPGISNINEVDEITNRIFKLFKIPLDVNGHKLYVTISIGVAVYPDNGRDGKTLLKKADIAMYKAKESGKSSLKYFNNYMSRAINLRSDIKKDLGTAIKNGEFFLCYQPLVDTSTKKAICLEALIRWKHPRKGIISPMEFIPIAEDTKLIVPIGEWVLSNACKQLKEWHAMGYTGCTISVNVSIIQLQQPDFAEIVCRILAETGLLPENLELEITESVFMESTHLVAKNLYYLKKQGVKISIDDFGTGYCSLNYLQKLAINNLKIDRSFICNIKVDVNKAIIDAVISLGHKINIEITAEGVETKEQYDYLKKKGCDKVQGYYFSKPLLPEEIIKFLEAGKE